MWGLAAHTVVMFLCLTISVVMELSQLSKFHIDERRSGALTLTNMGIFAPWGTPTGDNGHVTQYVLSSLMFPLNQWLADGLLVNHVSNPTSALSNLYHTSSCIVAMLYMLRATWLSSHV